jgi:hypothetical protein
MAAVRSLLGALAFSGQGPDVFPSELHPSSQAFALVRVSWRLLTVLNMNLRPCGAHGIRFVSPAAVDALPAAAAQLRRGA